MRGPWPTMRLLRHVCGGQKIWDSSDGYQEECWSDTLKFYQTARWQITLDFCNNFAAVHVKIAAPLCVRRCVRRFGWTDYLHLFPWRWRWQFSPERCRLHNEGSQVWQEANLNNQHDFIIKIKELLIPIFRRVLNVVCFLLVHTPAYEFYMPTFRNTLPVPSS